MRISALVCLVSSRKIPDVIDKIFKVQWFNGRGTYETRTSPENCCYFWAMTPSRANLSLRQLSHRRFWIFEAHFFQRTDPAVAHSVGLLLSHIDGSRRIIAMGDGRAWHFDHNAKVFKKNSAVQHPAAGVLTHPQKTLLNSKA